jgi:3-dehydroquinate dehydratase I
LLKVWGKRLWSHYQLHVGSNYKFEEVFEVVKKPVICTPICAEDYASVLKLALKAKKMGADMLEFRIDALDDPDPEKVKDTIRKMSHPIIATNRMREEGGFFDGSEKERIKLLIEAADYADFVDIELRTGDDYRTKVIKVSRSSIVSYHNFKKTPSVGELLEIVKREREMGDLAKFAVMPKSIEDTLTVLKVLSKVQDTIGLAMGNFGIYTRVVAPLFGSPIIYASVDKGSAPGQLDITTTKNILRTLMVID